MIVVSSWDALCARRFDRRTCDIPARLWRRDQCVRCRIIDLSIGGARVQFEGSYFGLIEKSDWELELPEQRLIDVTVIWKGSSELGVQFNVKMLRRSKQRALEKSLSNLLEQLPHSDRMVS